MKKLIIAFSLVLILGLGACTNSSVVDTSSIQIVKTELYIDSELTTETILPTTIDGVEIEWQSSKDDTLTTEFEIIQGLIDFNVTLTAILTYENNVTTKIFSVVILRSADADNTIINTAIDKLSFEENIITQDVLFPNSIDDVTITWESNDEDHLDSTGFVTRPTNTESDAIVILIASFSYNELVIEVEYTFTVTATVTTVVYESYYSGAEELTGEVLKAFLHELIDDHRILTYTELWTALAISDEDPVNSNSIILLYTGRSQLKTEIQSGNNNQDYWNREHVWPKAHGSFDTGDIEGTDMHHIRPTDVSVNAERGSLDFDYGGTIVFDGSIATLNLKDGNSFEPRDEVKGDVARMIFYMAVRYEGDNGELDLELSDLVNTRNTPFMGNLQILLEWSINDPVDAFEMNRNEVIFSYQGNRNPFVDHPEFSEYIWETN